MKIFKYFIAAGVGALTDLLFFYIFATILNFNYLLVGAIGFILTTYINYFISIKIVFTSGIRFNKSREIIIIYLVSIVGLLIHISTLFLFVDVFNIIKIVSKIFAIGTTFIWNFSVRNFFIFKENRRTS